MARATASLVLLAVLALVPVRAQAQELEEGGALGPESDVALSADDEAQLSLGGFRRYLERIRPTDPPLYRALDVRLDDLESREFAADLVFGLATGLGIAALAAAIPIYTELDGGRDLAIGLAIAGASTFVLGVVIQAIVRPGRDDLMALIDHHDELAGRR